MNDTLTAIREQHAVDTHESRSGNAVDPALTMTNPTKGTDVLDRSSTTNGVIERKNAPR